jgi:hypothetical protein
MLRYLVARPAQLLMVSVLLLFAGAALAAIFMPGGQLPAPLPPTTVATTGRPAARAPTSPATTGTMPAPGPGHR